MRLTFDLEKIAMPKTQYLYIMVWHKSESQQLSLMICKTQHWCRIKLYQVLPSLLPSAAIELDTYPHQTSTDSM
eukprot:scaffold161672_cov39-Prasinocladus_malaysianus.AAC.1